MGQMENPTGGKDLLAEGKKEGELRITRVKAGLLIAMCTLFGANAGIYFSARQQSSAETPPDPAAIETPPDPEAIQECYRRLLTNIQPSFDSGLKTARFSNHGYYPMAQALTADGQTECSATLAIQAMRVKKAARGR